MEESTFEKGLPLFSKTVQTVQNWWNMDAGERERRLEFFRGLSRESVELLGMEDGSSDDVRFLHVSPSRRRGRPKKVAIKPEAGSGLPASGVDAGSLPVAVGDREAAREQPLPVQSERSVFIRSRRG